MSELGDQDFQDLFPSLQPQDFAEDPDSFGTSLNEGFLADTVDDEESQSHRVPAPWENEADTQLLDESAHEPLRGRYQDFDTSLEKGKGRAVEEDFDLDAYDHQSEVHDNRVSNQEAPVVNAFQYQYQNAPSSYSTAPEYQAQSQSDYAALGYVQAGSGQSQFNGVTPAPSALAPNQASSSASGAGQISSRSKRRARKPATQPTDLPKEKKPVKQSKKKSLAEVRHSGSDLLWRPSPDQEWIPAVYHNDIWIELLEWTDQIAASYGGYDHPQARGIEPWNRTAFCLAQKSWARDRGARPGVLFFIQKTDVPEPAKPTDFFWHGRRVIDRDNLGMRWFENLPATISSSVEDFRLDGIQKLNPNIEWEDIWGRTPDQFRTGREPDPRIRGALSVPALSNRTLRFRREAGTLAWDRKDELGNEIALEFLKDLMGEDCIRENNTTGFGRDLTTEDVDQLDDYLRSEKQPEKVQARRLRATARAAARSQAQSGPSYSQHVQQAPPAYQISQQPAQQAQPPRASIQRAPHPTANGSAHSTSHQAPAQVSGLGQASSTSRYTASRSRQGPSACVPSFQAVNSANPIYGAPNQNGKRSHDVTHEHQQSTSATKRPRTNDSDSVSQGRPESVRYPGYPPVLQPTAVNPLTRSNVLSPFSRAGGAQTQGFDKNASAMSTDYGHLVGHSNPARHKRAHAESDDEDEEESGVQYKKPRLQHASTAQASGARGVRRLVQTPWRPSQALATSINARFNNARAPHQPINGFNAHRHTTNASRANNQVPSTPAPNGGYMNITISVPVGSEIVVKPRGQTYNLVGMAIAGQNVDWKVINEMALAASPGQDSSTQGTKRLEDDPDWQGYPTTARSSYRKPSKRLPQGTVFASNTNKARPTVQDSGPPPGLPEDFVEEGFEPEGYEDAIQYQDHSEMPNFDLSSSTVDVTFDTTQYPDQGQIDDFDFSSSTLGAPLVTSTPFENRHYDPLGTQVIGGTDLLDIEASASPFDFSGNLADPSRIDYYSQLGIPPMTTEEMDQILNEADELANASFINDTIPDASQNPMETFALRQADTSGASASGFSHLKYEQMQAEYQKNFGRPIFDPDFSLEDDILDPTTDVGFLQDYPLAEEGYSSLQEDPETSYNNLQEAPETFLDHEQAGFVSNDGGQGQTQSSSPTPGNSTGLTEAQRVTPETTIPSDPASAPEESVDSDAPAAPQGSESLEPALMKDVFGEDWDKDFVEQES